MAAVYEMKALIDRSPWNDVIAVGSIEGTKVDGTIHDSRSSTETGSESLSCGRSLCATPNGSDITKTVESQRRQIEQESKPAFNSSKNETRSFMTSSPSTSIGFSIARILSNSIGSCHVIDAPGNQHQSLPSPPRGQKLGQTTVSADEISYRSSSPDGVYRSEPLPPVFNRSAGSGKGPLDWQGESPASGVAVQSAEMELCLRRRTDENDHQCERPMNDFTEIDGDKDGDMSDDDEDFLEEDRSDNQSMPTDGDVEEDYKKSTDHMDVMRRHVAIDRVQQLMNMSDCPSGLQQKLSWLQCTRYKPPKLPRSKKLKDGGKKRKLGRNPRVPFTQHQVAVLEHKFHGTHYLSSVDVAELSAALNLTENRVKIWFQNRRARERRNKEEPDHVSNTHDGVVSLRSSPSEADRLRISSSTSPSMPSPRAIQAASNAFICREKTSAAAAAATAAAATAAAACYPESMMKHFNSSIRFENGVRDLFSPSSTVATSHMSWPYHLSTRNLPVGLRIPGCTVSDASGGFAAAADLLAHFSSTSLTGASTRTTMNDVIIGLSGMAAAVGVTERSRLPTFSPLQGFLR